MKHYGKRWLKVVDLIAKQSSDSKAQKERPKKKKIQIKDVLFMLQYVAFI